MTASELLAQRERLAALEPWRMRVGGRPASKIAFTIDSTNRAAARLSRPQVVITGVCDKTVDVF